MAKISVIVPVYNVEAYIEKCVRSLFEQTFSDIEYIFVDDCSSDQSIAILKKVLLEYPYRKDFVKIVQLPYNQKQHKARVRGIEEATGDYIIHCDPDDYVDHLMYETLYNKAVKEQCDIVWCGYKKINQNVVNYHKEISACNQKALLAALFDGSMMGSLCNKLVRKEIVKDVSIIQPQSPFIEDLLLVSQYVMLSNTFCYCEGNFYNYVVRDESIIAYYRSSDKLIQERAELIKINLMLLYQSVSLHSFDKFLLPYIIRQKFNQKQLFLPLVIQEETSSYWINWFPEINFSLFTCARITNYEKMTSLLLLLHLFVPLRKFISYLKNTF